MNPMSIAQIVPVAFEMLSSMQAYVSQVSCPWPCISDILWEHDGVCGSCPEWYGRMPAMSTFLLVFYCVGVKNAIT